MKRVYWSLGGGMVAWGVWFFASPFWAEESPAPVRMTEVSGLVAEQASAAAIIDVGATVRAPETVRQQVNALYASTAPKLEALETEALKHEALETEALKHEAQDELSAHEQATLVRKPVIDAIRLLNVSKADKYERMREALRNSGDSLEEWTLQAPDVMVEWERALDGQGISGLDERSVRCYLAGCEAQVYFKSESEYEAAARAFRSLSEEGAAHGGRVQTPPKQLEDGRWAAAWMMMRPDVGVE